MVDFAALSSSPSRVRQANLAAALQAIFAHRRLSRADLARRLGLNRSSAGHIIAELTARGLAREVADASPKSAGAGRPGILFELAPDAACFVGIEIGVEHITALRLDLHATVIDQTVVPFEGRSAPVSEAVGRAVALAFDGMDAETIERCEGVGLAAPAQLDRSGRVRVAPLLGWRDIDLAALMREALPIEAPSLVENDANAFAIGDAYSRLDRQRGVSLFLVIETGIGGGIVIDGQLLRGGHGLAGEIGHLHTSDPDGAELEEAIGLDRLLGRYGELAGADCATLARLLADVRDRVPAAVGVAEEWAQRLAQALVQVCRVIDPDRIVLGGSVAALYPMVSSRVAAHMEAYQSDDFPQPEITAHAAAETGAAYGAACMLHRRFLALGDEPSVGEAANPRETTSPDT